MTEYIESFISEVKESTVRETFPEITDSETPVWRGGPSMLSMVDKYILALVVLLIHFAFFVGQGKDSPDGEGQANFLYSLAIWLVDTTGVLGFVVTMLVLTKMNHFANFSTSGRWTTTWLLVSTMVPFTWKLMDFLEWSGVFVGSEFSNPLPAWNYAWFLALGIASFTMMVAFTLLYQSSFQYAITDKRIHIRKKFLYFDTSVHGISFQKVENLKADPTILGRIFGFGNVHIITGSGVGLQVESLSVSVGGAATDIKEAPKGAKRLISMLFGLITKQRNRTVMATDPADCLYGIRGPMKIYRLINELIDKNVGLVGIDDHLQM
jgi:membrane protein YdbS with pleckstrin-like domain